METYRLRTTVAEDGKLSIKGLPFRAGEQVEVIVRGGKKKAARSCLFLSLIKLMVSKRMVAVVS